MDIKRVQHRLLEMGIVIANILERNNIPYMITFGTLLGAIRHGGFIPWDDDFDMFLFNDSYDQAMKALAKELPSDMFLENAETEPLYFHGYAHVKDMNSIASCKQYPQDGLYEHKGLSIDLYRAYRMQECDLEEFLIKEHIAYLDRRFKIGSIDEDSYRSKQSMLHTQLNNLPIVNSRKDIFGMALAERSMDAEFVLPLKKVKFENTEFYAPSNPESILKSFYGDFMKLPPEDQRLPHYDDVIFK
jgi:lipopolysaccharide cholinephosphotransferase